MRRSSLIDTSANCDGNIAQPPPRYTAPGTGLEESGLQAAHGIRELAELIGDFVRCRLARSVAGPRLLERRAAYEGADADPGSFRRVGKLIELRSLYLEREDVLNRLSDLDIDGR